MTSEKSEVILCNNGEKGGGMLIFNPYDLDHVALLNNWLAKKRRGVVIACPFYTRSQMELMIAKKKKGAIKQKGILKP